MEALCLSLVGVHGITVAGKSADLHTVSFDCVLPLCKSLFVIQKHLGVAVSLAGEAAAADFNCFDAELFKFNKRLLKREIAEEVGKYAEFHSNIRLSNILLKSL